MLSGFGTTFHLCGFEMEDPKEEIFQKGNRNGVSVVFPCRKEDAYMSQLQSTQNSLLNNQHIEAKVGVSTDPIK